jgi:hypothetical protein
MIVASFRRERTGPTGRVHPVGESVRLKESELFSDVKFEDGTEECLPNESLRTECEVPECQQEATYLAPGHWCREHWTEWNDLERPEPGPEWMHEDRERKSPLVTIKQTGVPVVILKEHLMIYIDVPEEELPFQVHRHDLHIECERDDCTEESQNWQPRYWCRPHYMEWLEGDYTEKGLEDPGAPVPGWNKGPGAGRPNDYPELTPREQWAVDKRLGILDWEG